MNTTKYAGLLLFWIFALLNGLFFRAWGNADEQVKVRERRMEGICHAILGYMLHHHKELRYPPPAVYAKDGKALLSWRVLILPYLSEEALFREFSLSEPWDSETNKKLLDKMPSVYAPAGVSEDKVVPNST